MEKGKELVKVLVEFNGETLFIETTMAIIACRENNGANVGIMGTVNTEKLISMGAAIDKTIAENIDPMDAIKELLKAMHKHNCDCGNCEKEAVK